MDITKKNIQKLMIVDDNPDLLLSLRAFFETENFEVTTVDNGWNCLKELEKGFRGIIILDLMMPVMNGIETIKNMIIEGYIKENPVIILTAKKIQGEEFNEIDPYIYDYITKPFDTDELLHTVKKIAQNPKQKKVTYQ